MAIRVVCPNGHILKVKDSLAGKTGLCPLCEARVHVPRPSNVGLSEDDILAIVSSNKPRPRPHYNPAEELAGEPARPSQVSATERTGLPNKTCDKCNREISSGTHICPHCHTYIAGLSDL